MKTKLKPANRPLPKRAKIERSRSVKNQVGVEGSAIERKRNKQSIRKITPAFKNGTGASRKPFLSAHGNAKKSIERKRGSRGDESVEAVAQENATDINKTRRQEIYPLRRARSVIFERLLSNKHVDDTAYSSRVDINTVNNGSSHPVNDNNNVNENYEIESLPPHLILTSQIESAVPSLGFCDKLSCTFTPKSHGGGRLEDRLSMLSEPNARGYYLKRLGGSCDRIYRQSFQLLKMGDDRPIALLQINPRRTEHHFSRFELNPSDIGLGGVYEVKRVLKALFGERFKDDLRDGNITRLDAAVDVFKIRPDDLMVFSTSARQSGLFQRSFDKSGRETFVTETHTVGSQSSDYFVRCYDKAAQLWRVKAEETDGLITRVEVKLHPRTDNGVTLRVGDIRNARNPFSALVVTYYPTSEHSHYVFNLFVVAARSVGAERALKIISDKRVRSKFWNLLQDSVPNWWCPEKHWDEVLESLKVTGLFPRDIFHRK